MIFSPRHSLLLLLFALAACSHGRREATDAVVVAIESVPETLDRRMGLSHNAARVAELVTPGLTRIDPTGAAVPDLAASFEAIDEQTWRFHLRDDLRFSDGTPLRAEDVVATYRSLLDPALGSPYRGGFSYIESIQASDPRTVIFHLGEAFGAFPVDLTMGILPARLCDPAHRDALRTAPIGAGPYRVERWDGEGDIFLAPNPHHATPPASALIVRTVRDETTRLLELRKGRVDLVLGTVSPALLPELRRSPGLRVEIGPGAGVSYLTFNLEDPLLARQEVREAIALAIDREELARYKFKGAAQVADSLLRPGHWAYTEELRRYERQVDEAIARLRRVGATPIRLTLKTSTDRFRRSIALAIQAQLAPAGIELDLQPLEWGTFLNDVKRGNYQIAMLKWQPVVDPDILRLAYHSASIPTEGNGWGGGNRMRYRNERADERLLDGRRLADHDERRAAYAEVQQILARELPALPLLHEEAIGIISRGIEGVEVDPQGSFQSLVRARRVR